MSLFLYIIYGLFCIQLNMKPAGTSESRNETLAKLKIATEPKSKSASEQSLSKNATFVLPLRGEHHALEGYCYTNQPFTYAKQPAKSFVVLQRKKNEKGEPVEVSQLKEGDVPFEGFQVIVFPHLTSKKLETLSQEFIGKKSIESHEKQCPKSGSLAITNSALITAGLLSLPLAPNFIPQLLQGGLGARGTAVCMLAGIGYLWGRELLDNIKHDKTIKLKYSSDAQYSQYFHHKQVPEDLKPLIVEKQRMAIVAYIYDTLISKGLYSDAMPFLLTSSSTPEADIPAWYSPHEYMKRYIMKQKQKDPEGMSFILKKLAQESGPAESPLSQSVQDLIYKKCSINNDTSLMLIRKLDYAPEFTTKMMLTDLGAKKAIVEKLQPSEEAAQSTSSLIVEGVSIAEFPDIMKKVLPRKMIVSKDQANENDTAEVCAQAWESVAQQFKKSAVRDAQCIITGEMVKPDLAVQVKPTWRSPIVWRDSNAPRGWEKVSSFFHWVMPDESNGGNAELTYQWPRYNKTGSLRQLAWKESPHEIPQPVHPLELAGLAMEGEVLAGMGMPNQKKKMQIGKSFV
jgi:hypothetical protein